MRCGPCIAYVTEPTCTVVGVAVDPTVIEIVALVRLPPESVTAAVIVCEPLLSVRVKLAPAPIWPSRLDVQPRSPAMLPSSESFAVPWNRMPAPEEKLELDAGLCIVTV